VVISLDRQERGNGTLSASQEVSKLHGIPVIAVATLDDIIAHLGDNPAQLAAETAKLERIDAYRKAYGASPT
jgi:orotate phosphoribosyltransferase